MKGAIVITLGDKQVFNIGFTIDAEELHKLLPQCRAAKTELHPQPHRLCRQDEDDNNDGKLAYSVEEVSRLIPMSQKAIYEAIRQKQMPGLKAGGKVIVPKRQFNAWLDMKPFERKEQ
jgi:excisionase family DNA binding protein